MKKRLLSLILALVMCVGLAVPALTTPALAAATVQTQAGANLSTAERKIYEALADTVAAVAAGREASTETPIDFELGELAWTARELGLSDFDDWDTTKDAVNDKIRPMMDKVYTCLELNFPFEMFWANNYYNWSFWSDNDDENFRITKLSCSLDVTPAYRDGSGDMITADPDKIAKGRATTENAKAIVKANEGKSDYEKLTAYRDAICERNTYNNAAWQTALKDEDRFGRDHTYGDPWQLVYVFDENPSTNVVCEGYSKAFKYLCDLSEFNGDVTCYLVEGEMDGEAHMWNVVRMGDGNLYLADVTNSDAGHIGEHGGLFLTGASGSGRTYVVSHDGWKITYTYWEEQKGLFTDGYLPISSADYSPENDVPPAPAISFTDVQEGIWYEKAVNWAAAKGIAQGVGNNRFSPGKDCTHEQILTFLYRAQNNVAASTGDMEKAVNWAKEQGMTGEGFNPKAPCTRADAVKYIWQAMGSETPKKAAVFSDVPAEADYAQAAAWAVELGITDGTGGGKFSPGTVCNRGTIATFLWRTYVPEERLTVK